MPGLVTTVPVDGAAGARIVQLSGAFDTSNIAPVQSAIAEALDGGAIRLVVDLGAVTFLDSTMLSVLIDVHQRTQMLGGEIVLVRPRPIVWRVFEITGLDRLLRSAPDLATATARLAESER